MLDLQLLILLLGQKGSVICMFIEEIFCKMVLSRYGGPATNTLVKSLFSSHFPNVFGGGKYLWVSQFSAVDACALSAFCGMNVFTQEVNIFVQTLFCTGLARYYWCTSDLCSRSVELFIYLVGIQLVMLGVNEQWPLMGFLWSKNWDVCSAPNLCL